MAHLIDKDKVVAEINALLDDKFQCNSYDEETGFQNALFLVKKFIDTLKVKDIYLDKVLSFDEYKKFFEEYPDLVDEDLGFVETWLCAKYFFELGFNAGKENKE